MDPYHNAECVDRRNKIVLIAYAMFCCSLIIIIRLAYLQIQEQQLLLQRGKNNFLMTEEVPALRGNFLDCNGFVLASSRPVYDIYWQGSGKRFLLEEQQQELMRVIAVLGYESDYLDDEKIQHLIRAERSERRMILARDVSFASLCRLYEQCPLVSNIVIDNRFMRTYPHQSLGCHILGYLNRLKNC